MKISAKKIALSGIMLALALIVSLVESYIPPIVPMLPYAKIGLCNVVLLACFLIVGAGEGYIVLLLKCLLTAVYAGSFSTLLWSLPSALVAYTVMLTLHKTKLFSTTGLSVAGGMIHNFVQILVATIVIGTSVFFYLPYMLLAGGIAGLVTGIVCHFAVEGLNRKINPISNVGTESNTDDDSENFEAIDTENDCDTAKNETDSEGDKNIDFVTDSETEPVQNTDSATDNETGLAINVNPDDNDEKE